MAKLLTLTIAFMLSGCLGSTMERKDSTQYDKGSFNQLGKLDQDRMADYEIRENIESLKMLMLKLYKRNPNQLKKTTSDNAEQAVNWFFNGSHKWNFQSINNATDFKAVYQAFDHQFDGDRVLSLMTGLYTMLVKAHGGKTEFFITDSIDPQNLYNMARNIEISVWMLSTKKDEQGNLLLISNEMGRTIDNLSFEREFGKMIGRLDYFAYTLSEKTERVITRMIQNVTTGLLLPFI
ncbi:hypothetical protein N9K12_04500 [Methylophilaceae bacterium]|jgi:hypothetical protein|nr:hypothetical protein [Nitrosomonadales bacterium]MCH9842298.1 hypothetical protein [Betaproteobacteria bacterium]MDA7751179.1 hypothetical protein [Methylophilaceae bacterium]MBT6140896.1 hypothetical protein [Nitrosomonadales bacterium]MDA9086051.1 hypothetical protein [Methylophilaceae bacterium]|tara:strand:+ start:2782 stop:3489 length:708 start_codon:yes stop_codon:yes gene_type:complete